MKILPHWHAAAAAQAIALLMSCQQPRDVDRAAADGASASPARQAASAPQTETPAPSDGSIDTLALAIDVDDPDCLPGACLCRGEAERSSGLWRIGLETSELAAGVICIAADFDGNGNRDLALLGLEGRLGVVMYGSEGPGALYELNAGGFPELYEPRPVEGPGGEPASQRHGILVRHVGRNHAVFLWNGDAFLRILYPAAP